MAERNSSPRGLAAAADFLSSTLSVPGSVVFVVGNWLPVPGTAGGGLTPPGSLNTKNHKLPPASNNVLAAVRMIAGDVFFAGGAEAVAAGVVRTRGSVPGAAPPVFGTVKIGRAHCSFQHFTSLPAASAAANPGVSHIGQTTRTVFPFAGRGDSGIARLFAAASTPNGSSSSVALLAAGADLAGGVFALGAAAVGVLGALGRSLATGLGVAFVARPWLPPLPVFMFAPQNGQFSTSSSRTDCLQAGQVGNMETQFRFQK